MLGLLETISQKVGCEYLSELRRLENKEHLIKEIETINSEEYSVREWNDALEYLANTDSSLNSQIEIKERLLQILKTG